MLLTLVITLLLIGAAVVGTLYSNFLTFYDNFAETENYNKAYYAAIAALERAELVVKQHEPGYEGTGGWNTTINSEGETEWNFYGSGSDWASAGFSYLASGNSKSTNILRKIKSKASRIPAEGGGDVDWTLSTGNDALNYNKMDYENAEIFLLYYDKSNQGPYKKVSCSTGSSDCQKAIIDEISGKIRLPQALTGSLGYLDTGHAFFGEVKNDAIVDRQIRGNYGTTPFTIYSTQDVVNGGVGNQDSMIREDDINRTVGLSFSGSISPIIGKTSRTMTVISSASTDISGKTYRAIFSDHNFQQMQLRLALLNLLKPREGVIYPYLEYYLDFGTGIADKYFTMNAEGKYGNFQVNLIVQKPTIKESILGSFTTVF